MTYHFDAPKIYKHPRHHLCDTPIDLFEGQALYNQGVVFAQLKCMYPEDVIRGLDAAYVVPAKPEDIKLLETLEWVKAVRKA